MHLGLSYYVTLKLLAHVFLNQNKVLKLYKLAPHPEGKDFPSNILCQLDMTKNKYYYT